MNLRYISCNNDLKILWMQIYSLIAHFHKEMGDFLFGK